MKTTALLMCLGLLPLIAGCSVQRPHGGMRMREAPAVTPDHFRIFDAAGTPVTMDDIVRAAADADAVFIGEEHGNPAAHHLELEILRRLHEACASAQAPRSPRDLLLSMEMFERDIQGVVDEYLADLITERHFLKASRPWPAYRSDYRPLIEFAKTHGVPVVAANAPGRHVNRAARLGRSSLEGLPRASKAWLPPLPYGLPSDRYREKFKAFWETLRDEGGGHGPVPNRPAEKPAPDEISVRPEAETNPQDGFERMLDAQALWDAGMAWSLAEALERRPGALALHVNGKFHSEYGLGIPEHLVQYRPGASFVTVTVLSLPVFPDFDPGAAGAGTFIIITDPSLTEGAM
ncbi:ChaN family lipoprotein [Desulfococcus sp.]|uniref:ChaN family lipoprotein n=1 Tax=Desulfococcus sp. TaxID=2025834 RepID=UPI0035944D3D